VSADEPVALYDPDDEKGREIGMAPRWLVRRLNLPHAATAVLVRRGSGEILVHKRALTKDIWPGVHDCASGGVVAAGERPDDAAVRELAEEVGVTGVVPRPLLRTWYRDDDTWYLAHAYEVLWDGEVSFPDGEVAHAWWEPETVLRARLADPSWPFVPDTRMLLELLSRRPATGIP
jgi:8-oxo-dGTP pyrophosphatase MutT (NUDIX family)